MQDVSGFYYNGYDITRGIASGIDDGSLSGVHFLIDGFMDTENREVSVDPSNAFSITLMSEIEPFELEGNIFSLTLVNGLEISKVIYFEESKYVSCGNGPLCLISNGIAGIPRAVVLLVQFLGRLL